MEIILVLHIITDRDAWENWILLASLVDVLFNSLTLKWLLKQFAIGVKDFLLKKPFLRY